MMVVKLLLSAATTFRPTLMRTVPLAPRSPARAVIMASDITPEEHTFRAQFMLDAKDYKGAAEEASRALESLPGLANASAVRGRALLLIKIVVSLASLLALAL